MSSGISAISGNNSYWYYLEQSEQSSSQSSVTDDLFSKIDTNSDGSVSSDEFKTFRSNLEAQFMSAVMGSQYDGGTGNTTVTDDLFSKIDTNGDGAVTSDEFETFRANMQAQNMDSQAQGLSGSGNTTSYANGTTSSDQSGTSLFASLIMEAITKYMSFAQVSPGSASTSTVNVSG